MRVTLEEISIWIGAHKDTAEQLNNNSVAWVKQMALSSVGGHHPICWGPGIEQKDWGRLFCSLSWGSTKLLPLRMIKPLNYILGFLESPAFRQPTWDFSASITVQADSSQQISLCIFLLVLLSGEPWRVHSLSNQSVVCSKQCQHHLASSLRIPVLRS